MDNPIPHFCIPCPKCSVCTICGHCTHSTQPETIVRQIVTEPLFPVGETVTELFVRPVNPAPIPADTKLLLNENTFDDGHKVTV